MFLSSGAWQQAPKQPGTACKAGKKVQDCLRSSSDDFVAPPVTSKVDSARWAVTAPSLLVLALFFFLSDIWEFGWLMSNEVRAQSTISLTTLHNSTGVPPSRAARAQLPLPQPQGEGGLGKGIGVTFDLSLGQIKDGPNAYHANFVALTIGAAAHLKGPFLSSLKARSHPAVFT